MKWRVGISPVHDWSWSSEELPNGWSALVTDNTPSVAPRQPTIYSVSAVCWWWLVSAPRQYATLAEAKRVALRLAMSQGQASGDPGCIVELGDFGFE